MPDRHAVLCCALVSLLVALVPLSRLTPRVAALRALAPPDISRELLAARTQADADTSTHQPQSSTPTPAESRAEAARQLSQSEVRGAQTATASPPVAQSQPDPRIAPESSATAEPPPTTTAPATPESLLAHNQMVIFYGSPESSGLGILGVFAPNEAAQRVRQQAQTFDDLNGARGVVPAMDLIYSQVQSEPTENGMYLRYLPDSTVNRYINLAEANNLQLVLDLQIGRNTPLAEVKRIEPFLTNPRVHVALDPEYAVGSNGIPLVTTGTITGDDINAVQTYLSSLVQRHHLPPKLLFVHQYLDDTIVNGAATRTVDNVDLILNMDAFGAINEKIDKYRHFAAEPYAHKRGFNVFLQQDERVLTEQELLRLTPAPDVIFYQ